MSKYLAITMTAALSALLCDVTNNVASSHETMRDQARRDSTNRNNIIELLTGTGEFAAEWDSPTERSPLAANNETIEVSVGSLAELLRYAPSPYTPLDAGTARGRVASIAMIDPDHPVVRNWQVVRAACYTGDAELPAWPDVEAAVEAGRAAVKAALDEIAWQEQAAREREEEAARVAAAEAERLAAQQAGGEKTQEPVA